MEELKVTKERILEAAKGCSTAKTVLEKLFPEAFEDEDWMEVEIGQYFTMYNTQICQLVRYGSDDLDITILNCESGNRYFDEKNCFKREGYKEYISKRLIKERNMKKVKVKIDTID